MLEQIQAAVDMYRNEPESWNTLVKQAMSADHSWKRSAQKYFELYMALGKRR
jgi:starch synthase